MAENKETLGSEQDSDLHDANDSVSGIKEKLSYRDGEPCWVEVVSRDKTKGRELLTKLFNYSWFESEVTGQSETYDTAIVNELAVLGCVQMDNSERNSGTPSYLSVYFCVDEIYDKVELAISLGGNVVLPVTDIDDVGKMAIILDPSGAKVFLLQPKANDGAEIMHEPNTVTFFELMTDNLEVAKSFYSDFFGWSFETTRDPADNQKATYVECYLDKNEKPIAGMIEVNVDDENIWANWSAYFNVANIADFVELAKNEGVVGCMEPFSAGPGTIAPLQDENIGLFNVIQYK